MQEKAPQRPHRQGPARLDGAVDQVRLTRPPRVGDLEVKVNKATVLRLIEDLFNTGDLDIADEVLAGDYVDHSPSHPGLSGPDLAGLRLRQRWGGWRRESFTASSTSHVSVYKR